jgi:DNA gyrase subunit A
LLATRNAKTIRFPVPEVRVFKGRESTGVRGVRLADGDDVISLSIIRHVDVSVAEARAYLKQAAAARRALSGDELDAETPIVEAEAGEAEGSDAELTLTTERYASLGAAEQFLVTVSENGFGKRTSAYEYRASGRGGQGYAGMGITDKTGRLVATFPVEDGDELVLATDAGQLIRFPVRDVRVAGRATQGVILFRTAEGELVVSAAHLPEAAEGDEEPEDDTDLSSDEG